MVRGRAREVSWETVEQTLHGLDFQPSLAENIEQERMSVV
jgi:hypothetical protein